MKLESVYLLAGPETGKRETFIADLRRSIVEIDGSPAEEHRLYAQESSVGDLIGLLQNGSLFSGRRLVEYRGAELIKGKDELGAVIQYVKSPSPEAVLLLVTEQFYVERQLEDAVGKARKTTFFEMFENEKPRWIERRLGQLGLSIDSAGIGSILELVENDSAALESACSRLALLFPAGTRLSETEVESAIAHSKREDAFSLFERMVTGSLAEALDVLDAVLADRRGDAVQIVSALIWSFRRMQRLHIALKEGDGFEAACMKLQIRSKSLQRQSRSAIERYSLGDCERIVLLASDFDARVRALGSIFERSLLQLLVYGIMERHGRLNLTAKTGAAPGRSLAW
ncbi:MAG TPA: DNA polymerase III subunit delta [Rectinemataceae bacterium]|nr:DNA polymerase III subunit delta [Rectinemataceae bacterium]